MRPFSFARTASAALIASFAATTAFGSAAGIAPMAVSGGNGGPALIPTGQYITANGRPRFELSTPDDGPARRW